MTERLLNSRTLRIFCEANLVAALVLATFAWGPNAETFFAWWWLPFLPLGIGLGLPWLIAGVAVLWIYLRARRRRR